MEEKQKEKEKDHLDDEKDKEEKSEEYSQTHSETDLTEEDDKLEVGYFYLLGCNDIKETEDGIRAKYLTKS